MTWFLSILNLFKKDDWTTVNPDEELKEWIDVPDEKQGLIE